MKYEKLEALKKSELIEIIHQLLERISELESKVNMTSTNSSKAPSSDVWKRPQMRSISGANPGGQPGHKGNFIKIECEADEVREIRPDRCAKCGEDLGEMKGSLAESRNKIDIEIRRKIMRYEQMEVICPCCGNENLAEFPEDVNSHVSYGEGVQSIGVLLTNYANVSYGKTQKIMNDVLEVPISVGTLVNHVKEFASKCERVTAEIAETVKASEVTHFDETSTRVNGANHWLHTASTREATYNTVHSKRGVEGCDDNGVLKGFGGVAVHDCLQMYFTYENCDHALCNAHLLRELQGVVENTGQSWASQMQQLLREMKLIVDDFKRAGKASLPAEYIRIFADEYKRITKIGETENPLTEEQQQNAKKKRSKPRNLLDRFIQYRTEVCRFADNFAVPFDNNQAERDIRNTKVKQKVSGCFRSDDGAKNFAKISSVIGTAIKQGAGAFKTVSDIFAGSLNSIFRKTQLEQ